MINKKKNNIINKKKKKFYIKQIILLTNKILKLNIHLKKNNKDYNTIRSLIKIVYKKKKLLKYIKKKYMKLYLIIEQKYIKTKNV